MKTILYSFLTLLFICSINIKAQEVNISGIVTDKVTGEVLIGTNLLLYQDEVTEKSVPLTGTATNKFGFYSFTKLAMGKYVLVARNIGYKTSALEVLITIPRGVVDNNIELVATDIQLDEVTVTGEHLDNVNISTISLPPQVIQMLPSVSGEIDIFKSLQLLPGVQTASEMSNGLYIRGGSPDQTLTLVDGMTLYNPAHLGNFTSTFNSNAVQDITLIKGAFPAQYGGRLSSVLDIKLKSGTRQKEQGTLGIGTINSFLSVEGPLGENSTFILSGRAMYYDKLLKSINDDSNIPRYNYFDINSKFTYNFENNNNVSMSIVYSKDRLYDGDNGSNFKYDITWENAAGSINWRRILSKSTFTNTTLNVISYNFETNLADENFSSNSNYYAKTKITDVALRNISEARWHDNHVARFGFEMTYHNFDVLLSNFYDYRLETDQTNDYSFIVASIFAQNETNFSEILKMNLGARLNYVTDQKELQVEPRVSISYTPLQFLTFKAAAARAHQNIHLLTRNDKSLPTDFWFPVNKNIKPSSSWQYVAGIESSFNEQAYVVSVEGYYRDMKNLYEFKNDASFNPWVDFDEQLTDGQGEAYGVEFFINKRIGQIKGWLGYTLSWTRRQFDEINNGNIFYPRYDRRHDISVALTYDINKNIKVGLTWVYATGQRITMPNGQYIFTNVAPYKSNSVELNASSRNGVKLPSYHKFDLNLSYNFLMGSIESEIYLNIYNVYNRNNVFSYYITQKENQDGTVNPVINQIVLFPFLPTIGIKISF